MPSTSASTSVSFSLSPSRSDSDVTVASAVMGPGSANAKHLASHSCKSVVLLAHDTFSPVLSVVVSLHIRGSVTVCVSVWGAPLARSLFRLSVRALASIASDSTLARRKVPRYFSTKLVPALQSLGRRIATLGSEGTVAAPRRQPERAQALPRLRPQARAPKAQSPWFRAPQLPVRRPVRVVPTTGVSRRGLYDVSSTPSRSW